MLSKLILIANEVEEDFTNVYGGHAFMMTSETFRATHSFS